MSDWHYKEQPLCAYCNQHVRAEDRLAGISINDLRHMIGAPGRIPDHEIEQLRKSLVAYVKIDAEEG